MDLNATLDIIIKDLDETRDIIDDLKNYPDIPVLQIELAKSKCKSAAEMIAFLKNIPLNKYANNQTKEEKQPVKTEVRSYRPSSVKPKMPEKAQFHEAPPETGNDTKIPGRVIIESAIIADQFGSMPESFNDTLRSQKHEEEIAEVLKSKPVSSLSEAIGINDKFLFIREIFNGDFDLYNNAITRLDETESLDEANEMVSGFAGGNTDSEAIKQLISLIKRKFPSNE